MTSSISILNDDLLLEIFLRLSDFTCIVECALVCKRWFLAIVDSKLNFSVKFNRFHRQKRITDSFDSSLPFTLLYREYGIHNIYSWEFYSERSKIFDYGKGPLLGFLSWKDAYKCYFYIWSSFEDLLLVQRSPTRVYICNPLTRQSVAIPESPYSLHRYYKYALVVLRDYYDSNNLIIKYKVVKISLDVKDLIHFSSSTLLHLSIFCSETRQWNHSTIKFAMPISLWNEEIVIVGSNGIVYWPCGYFKLDGIVALNPCSQRCRLIGFPNDYNMAIRAHVGVVRGRLRLVQFYRNSRKFVYKAWELVDEGDDDKMYSWNLVHDHNQIMKMNLICDQPTSLNQLTVFALHPDDQNVFFLNYTQTEIYECRILGQNHNHVKYLCPFPQGSHNNNTRVRVMSLLHPWWPTQIPH
ncbi:hypothetical protein CsatA_022516 [Cannabis sativa]